MGKCTIKRVADMTDEEKIKYRKKWVENSRRFRKKNPDKNKEYFKKAIEKLLKRHGVNNSYEYKLKKYSSPDFKPSDRQKEIIERLVHMALFHDGYIDKSELKNHNVTKEQARTYGKTVYFKQRLEEEREKLIKEAEEKIRMFVQEKR
jgi:hypothetical protein